MREVPSTSLRAGSSLRLKSGYAPDDADGRSARCFFKLTHHRLTVNEVRAFIRATSQLNTGTSHGLGVFAAIQTDSSLNVRRPLAAASIPPAKEDQQYWKDDANSRNMPSGTARYDACKNEDRHRYPRCGLGENVGQL